MSRIYADIIGVPEDGTWPAILALVVGLAYAGVGILQILIAFGILPPFIGFGDILGGFLLLVVAAVFLTGVRPLTKDNQEGYAFIAVGYILAAILFALQVMVIITNGLGWFLQFEDWLGWNLLNDITPSLWMFLVLMTSTGGLWVLGNLREKLAESARRASIQ